VAGQCVIAQTLHTCLRGTAAVAAAAAILQQQQQQQQQRVQQRCTEYTGPHYHTGRALQCGACNAAVKCFEQAQVASQAVLQQKMTRYTAFAAHLRHPQVGDATYCQAGCTLEQHIARGLRICRILEVECHHVALQIWQIVLLCTAAHSAAHLRQP
jgi:hypothetical protein